MARNKRHNTQGRREKITPVSSFFSPRSTVSKPPISVQVSPAAQGRVQMQNPIVTQTNPNKRINNDSGTRNNTVRRPMPASDQSKVRADKIAQIVNALKRAMALLLARRTQATNNAENQKKENARKHMGNMMMANQLRAFLKKKLRKLHPPIDQSKPVRNKKRKTLPPEELEHAITTEENNTVKTVHVESLPLPPPPPLPPPAPVSAEPKKPSVFYTIMRNVLLTFLTSQLMQNELLAAIKEAAKQASTGLDNVSEEMTTEELSKFISTMSDEELEEVIATMSDEELAGLISTMNDDERAQLDSEITTSDKELAESSEITKTDTASNENAKPSDPLLAKAAVPQIKADKGNEVNDKISTNSFSK